MFVPLGSQHINQHAGGGDQGESDGIDDVYFGHFFISFGFIVSDDPASAGLGPAGGVVPTELDYQYGGGSDQHFVSSFCPVSAVAHFLNVL